MYRFKLIFFFIFFTSVHPLHGMEQSVIFTVDMNKLLKFSNFGISIAKRNNLARQNLQNENDALEAELLLEEKALSELRNTLNTDEFRTKAIEFDLKVSAIRVEQATKEEILVSKIRKEEAEFYTQVYPLLYELVSDRGGLVLIDQRNVILWDSSVDITDDAILLINQVIKKSE